MSHRPQWTDDRVCRRLWHAELLESRVQDERRWAKLTAAAKPRSSAGLYGKAEVVPFRKTEFFRSL